MLYDFAIIGGGAAGYSAAMYARRLNLKVILFAEMPGGMVLNTDKIENYPGFLSISGFDLFQKIKEQAEFYKIEAKFSKIDKVIKEKKIFKLYFKGGQISAKTILFATGSSWRRLNIPGEKELANRGVHYCALCDGPLYRGKTAAVIGGGNSAVKEAFELANFAEKVYLICREAKLKAEPANLEKIENNKKIKIIYNTNITAILGSGKAEALKLDSPYQNSDILKVQAVFIAVGHVARSDLAKSLGVKTTRAGDIKVDRNSQTNIAGVFAAGDVTDFGFKQLITGVAEAVKAAYSAYQIVSEKG